MTEDDWFLLETVDAIKHIKILIDRLVGVPRLGFKI